MLDKMVNQIKNPEEAAGIIKRYERMLKAKNVKIINIVAKQVKLLNFSNNLKNQKRILRQ